MDINSIICKTGKVEEFINSISDMAFIIDGNGNVKGINKSVKDNYGYEEDEISHFNIKDIIKDFKIESSFQCNGGEAADTVRILNKPMDSSLFISEDESFYDCEDTSPDINRCIAAEGAIEAKVKCIDVSSDGESLYILIAQDISEMEINREKFEQLNSIVGLSGEGIITRDLNGKILSWNRGAEIIFGYSSRLVIGKNISIIMADQEKDNDVLEVSEKISKGEIVERHDRLARRMDGNTITVSMSISPVRDLKGCVTSAAIFISDVSEERRRNADIEKFSAAIDQSSDYIIIMDGRGRIEYANTRFFERTKFKRNSILGKTMNVVNSGYHTRDFYENLWRTISKGLTWKGEICNKMADGELVWWNETITPIKNIKGEIVNYLSINEDVTEKKRLQASLNIKNEELEEAKTRLKETQLSLIQEDKMASIGQLSAGIAHEINNPLGFVMSNFDTLKKYINKYEALINVYRKAFDMVINEKNTSISALNTDIKNAEKASKIEFITEDVKELFKDTDEGLGRVRKIIGALRAFAHEGVNKVFEQYDINDGIKTTLIIANNEIKYNSKVILELGDIPAVDVYPEEINQVLLNLIVNASHAIKAKYSGDEETGTITIKTYCDRDKVYISVTDNGIGIKEENLKRVFEPFFTTKPAGKGTGLGLSISYDIICNKHNGSLNVNSKYGEGTTITIELPIIRN